MKRTEQKTNKQTNISQAFERSINSLIHSLICLLPFESSGKSNSNRQNNYNQDSKTKRKITVSVTWCIEINTIEIPKIKFIVRVWPNNAADAMPVKIVATVDEYFFKIVSVMYQRSFLSRSVQERHFGTVLFW